MLASTGRASAMTRAATAGRYSTLATIALALLAACSSSEQEAAPDYLALLWSADDFTRLEGERGNVKFLAQVDGREPVRPEECLFQNTTRYEFHIPFLRDVFSEFSDLDLAGYESLVLRSESRRFWGGDLKRFEQVTHPVSGQAGIYALIVYQDPRGLDGASIDSIVKVDQRIKRCAPFAERTIVFVPTDAGQEDFVRATYDELVARGVAIRFPTDF
jgi:hypothetical protein